MTKGLLDVVQDWCPLMLDADAGGGGPGDALEVCLSDPRPILLNFLEWPNLTSFTQKKTLWRPSNPSML